MTLSSENMMKLMAYADGELEAAERTNVEMLLARDVDAVSFVEQIAGLGELVELGYAGRSGKAVASFDVADAVMRLALANESDKKDIKPSPVTSIEAGRAAREKRGSHIKIGVAIASVFALAASVFVFAQHRADETPMAVAPTPAAQPATSGAPGTGVAIESAGKSVSVFYLPTANELSTSVVVWVDETGEK